MKDWIMELCPEIAEWQAELIAEHADLLVASEREACAKVVEQAEKQEPVAWVYPEGLEALKSAKPWVAYGSNGDGPHSDGVQRIPLYLNNDAVAPRVEPRASESGAGFESLPASPNQPEPVAWIQQVIDDLHALHDTELIREIDSGDALIRLDDAIATVEEAAQRHSHPRKGEE